MLHMKESLEKDGFAVIENFISDEEADILISETMKLIKNIPSESKKTVFSTTNSESQQNKDTYFLNSSDKICFFYEESALNDDGELNVEPNMALNKIGHALHALNPIFRKITFDKRVKETFYQLGFVDPAVVQSMYIFKNPEIGSEVTAHQDSTYLYTEPMRTVGLWIALEDATIENGCLWFSKGSHKSGTHRRYIRNPEKNANELLIYTSPMPHYQISNFTPVPVKKGTCIVIHGEVVHYSTKNKSTKSRHAYTFHVVEQRNNKYSKSNWIQPKDDAPFLSLYKN